MCHLRGTRIENTSVRGGGAIRGDHKKERDSARRPQCQFVAVGANSTHALMLSTSNTLIAQSFGDPSEAQEVPDVFPRGGAETPIKPKPASILALDENQIVVVAKIDAEAVVLDAEFRVVRRRNLADVSEKIGAILESQQAEAEQRNREIRALGNTKASVSVVPGIRYVASDGGHRIWITPGKWTAESISAIGLDAELSRRSSATLDLQAGHPIDSGMPMALIATPSTVILTYRQGIISIYNG